MRKIKKDVLLFIVGAAGYGIIEILWRGYTHPTMLFAGGISFLAFAYIERLFFDATLLLKVILAAVSVTAVELLFGVVFNIVFDMKVWDYSGMPFNFLGQICLLFTGVWGILGFLFMPLAATIDRMLG